MPYKGFTIHDADDRFIDREFENFAKDVFGAQSFKKEKGVDLGPHQYSFYVPGRLRRAEFEEGMNEICERLGCTYELVDQAPEAPSRQYFSENLKLMYPSVKSYEILKSKPDRFKVAKDLFRKSWGQEFDESSEDDREDIVLLWNEYMEDMREWKIVEVKLHFPDDPEEIEVVEEEIK